MNLSGVFLVRFLILLGISSFRCQLNFPNFLYFCDYVYHLYVLYIFWHSINQVSVTIPYVFSCLLVVSFRNTDTNTLYIYIYIYIYRERVVCLFHLFPCCILWVLLERAQSIHYSNWFFIVCEIRIYRIIGTLSVHSCWDVFFPFGGHSRTFIFSPS